MNNLKEIDTEKLTCSYFDYIIKIVEFDFNNTLPDEKSYENILIYTISYKTLIGTKPLRTRFDVADGFIRVYDGTRYLVLFCPEKYDVSYNRIRYLISQKGGIPFLYQNWLKWRRNIDFA